MFKFYDITDEQRHEINIWADSVIKINKKLMSSEKAYWLWSDRLYYQPGKDTWADEAWWIEIAKKSFAKHKDNSYKGIGYPVQVVPSLEILVHHFPEDYRDYARDKLDRWYEECGYHDPDYWFDLILAVYPDHPATEILFEEQENVWETSVAIKLGDHKTISQAKENILSDLKDRDIYWLIHNLSKFNRIHFSEVFPQSQTSAIELEVLEIIEQELMIDSQDSIDLHSLLRSAIELEWYKIIEYLANSKNYLTKLIYTFEKSSSTDFLLWSLTNNNQLT
jgi:hypothetical protein